MRGHNEKSFRLDELVEQAKRGLSRVAAAEADALEGWLTYGAALNEGRTLFPGDREFGQWLDDNVLRQVAGAEVEDHERSAAMWAAANLDQFEEARDAGNARTIRGIHAKWKEIEAERERAEEEAKRKAEAEANAKDPARKPSDTSGADKAETSVANSAAGGSAPDTSSDPDIPKSKDEDSGSGLPSAAPAPDPYGYAKLTDEALLDLANGLRASLDEEKAKRKAAEAERDDFKAKWQEALAQHEMGRALGNAQRQRDTAQGRLKEEMTKNARQGRRISILEAEVKKLQRQIEGEEITL